MLYYDRIDISKGIDLAESNSSMICRYWFFNHVFKFQDPLCNGCHDLTMLSINISNIATITVKNVDYIISVLFITLGNLKQLIYQKILFLKVVDINNKYS